MKNIVIEKNRVLKYKCYFNLLFIPLGMGLIFLSKLFPDITEMYSRNVYSFFMNIMLVMTNYIPFSVIEVLLLFVPAILIIYLANRIIYSPKDKKRENIIKFGGWIVSWISVIFFAFVLLEGINYNRIPFSETGGFEIKKSSKEELSMMCKDLIAETNDLRYRIDEDDTGVSKLAATDVYELSKRVYSAFEKLAEKYPVLSGEVIRPKPVALSKLMSYTEITGIFSPLTMEANINADVTAYSLPATMCHEMSHVRGVMREDEANFIAYLACKESDYTDIKYSGMMLALVHSMNQLYSADYELFLDRYAEYSDGVKRDFEAYSQYWKKFEGPVAEVSSKVNDTYLKLNNQTDGGKSYGRMVDLLLAEHRQSKGE